MRIIIRSVLIIILSSPLFATAQSGVRVKSTIDRNSILIGERITLSLEADIPENQQIRFFNIDTIEHFEFIDRGKIDTVNTSEGTLLRQDLVITSFDSGQWVIPSFPLDLQNQYRSDSFIVNVSFTPFDTSKPYHDVKDIIEVEPESEKEEKKQWLYYAIAVAVLLAALLYVLLRGRKPKEQVAQTVDPYQDALQKLNALQAVYDMDAKAYYTTLIDIFRNYLAKRKNLLSMQKITDELVMLLDSIGLPKDLYKSLAAVLRMSDYVKFAKFQPSQDDKNESLSVIKQSIDTIEKSSHQ